MPPNILTDYHLKRGIGEARFGLIRRSRASLTRALKIAQDAALHEFVFKVERIKDGLHHCEQGMTLPPVGEVEPVIQSEAVREVLASLAQVATERL